MGVSCSEWKCIVVIECVAPLWRDWAWVCVCVCLCVCVCVCVCASASILKQMSNLCSILPTQLCLGALSQPLSGCIRLLYPGALDPVCDPAPLAPLTLLFLSLCPGLTSTCLPRHSRPGPPASRPAGGGRGPWRHGSPRRTQPSSHERCAPSSGPGSGVQLHPTSLQALQLTRTLPAGQPHLSVKRNACVY